MKTGILNEEDRLSDLPDSVILHILSFLKTEEAFQTSILSKRWKNIPKYLTTLILKPSNFNYTYLHGFDNFVSQILSLRDHSTSLYTLDLMEYYDDFMEPDILKNIVEYAVSHNVQLLRITITCDIQQLPSCFFSSETLTFLDLAVNPSAEDSGIFPNSLNLPALTTLVLRSFYFYANGDGCAEPFSAFNKLDTLIIEDCQLLDAHILCVSSTTLVNLTMNYYDSGYCLFDSYKCKLSTPSLCNLNYSGTLIQTLCRSDLCSLKHVCIDVDNEYSHPFNEYYPFVLNLLLELANIKSLTISSKTLQVLSLVPDLLKVKLTSLYNLESLRVKMKPLSPPPYPDLGAFKFYSKQHQFKLDIIVNFLLQNSPSAKIISLYND